MNLIALPILIPLLLIIIHLFINAAKIAKIISIIGSGIILFVAIIIFMQVNQNGIQVIQLGGWKAPYGISLVIDFFSAIMLIASAVLAFAISIFAYDFIPKEARYRNFDAFFFTLLMGVNGALTTGDVFNLYVWFEVMLISSFVLITLGNSKAQLEGGIKYMAMNLFGSLLFLAGLGLLYGKTGTLNMAHLAQILKDDNQAILMNTSAVLFFVAFGIKAAVFPLYFWLPASYHTPNITISSLFAGLLTKVGVYTLIRFFTLFFVHDQQFWHQLLLIIAGLTMVLGGMAASTHYETRRILSYHIISQIGYMIMGLGMYTPLAIAGAIFFIVHNMVAKTNIFLIAGLIEKIKGTYYLKDVGGLFKENPMLAILFFIPAMALAGFPPLSGFFAKFILIKAGFEDGHYFITAIALITGLLTLYSMIKIWNEAFLKKQPKNIDSSVRTGSYRLISIIPIFILSGLSIFMGIFAGKFFNYCLLSANQLLDPSNYINAVF